MRHESSYATADEIFLITRLVEHKKLSAQDIQILLDWVNCEPHASILPKSIIIWLESFPDKEPDKEKER